MKIEPWLDEGLAEVVSSKVCERPDIVLNAHKVVKEINKKWEPGQVNKYLQDINHRADFVRSLQSSAISFQLWFDLNKKLIAEG